jgi:nucleoside-diphosphate-sugar epimerase
VHGSILEPEALEDAMRGADLVFHLAAMGSVPRSIKEPERCFDVNLTGTLRVAQAARDAGTTRWVFSGSSSAYGDDESLPKLESQLPRPISPYAASKVASEYVVRAWAVSYGLAGLSLRYFNVFGPGQPADSAYSAVIAAFISRLLRGESPAVFGDGQQSRDFTHVSNAVYANLLAGSSRREHRGEVVNVGCGRRTSLLELLDILGPLTGSPGVQAQHQPARDGDVRHSLADLTRAGELLGYRPITTLEDGLAATVEWYRGLAGARSR